MEHEWRKPRPGMIKQAAEDFDLDLTQSWMIGDSPRDVASGAAAGCRTILIRDPMHLDTDQSDASTAVSPNFIVKTLADAARIVAREGRNPHPDLVPTPLPQAATNVAAPAAANAAGVPSAATSTPSAGASASSPAAPPPLPTPPGAAAASIDTQALADKLARQLERAVPPQEPIKPILEEILVQLRQQQRAHDIPESSLASQAAIIIQVFAIVCVIVGVWGAVTIPLQLDGISWDIAMRSLLRRPVDARRHLPARLHPHAPPPQPPALTRLIQHAGRRHAEDARGGHATVLLSRMDIVFQCDL